MRYPLKQFGIETGPASFRPGPFKATSYDFVKGRAYDVIAYESDLRQPIGTCTVDGAPGNLTVEPSFELDRPGEFWAVWHLDEDGTARLQRVLLQRDSA
jgi:hypothetical protein